MTCFLRRGYAVSFDLTPTQTLLGGVSAAFGPNSGGTDTRHRTLRRRPVLEMEARRQSWRFPVLSRCKPKPCTDATAWTHTRSRRRPIRSACFLRRRDSGRLRPVCAAHVRVPARLGAGLRFDYVASNASEYEAVLGPDPARGMRRRIAPNLTWYPANTQSSACSIIMTSGEFYGPDHSVWLQFEFLLGSHAAHKF